VRSLDSVRKLRGNAFDVACLKKRIGLREVGSRATEARNTYSSLGGPPIPQSLIARTIHQGPVASFVEEQAPFLPEILLFHAVFVVLVARAALVNQYAVPRERSVVLI